MLDQTGKILFLRGLWQLILLQSVAVPFYYHRGLSTSDIFVVQCVFLAILTIFDIPTSIVSDRIGRKKCLIIAAAAKACGGFLLVPNFHMVGILIAYVFIGIGNSFYSGVESSLLYEGIQLSRNPEEKLRKALGASYSITLTSLVISSILGGIIAQYEGLEAVSLINGILATSSFVITLSIRDIKRSDEGNVVTPNISKMLSDAIETVFSSKRRSLAGTILMMGALTPLFTILLQLHMYSMGTKLVWFGIINGIQNTIGISLGMFLRSEKWNLRSKISANTYLLIPAMMTFSLLPIAGLIALPILVASFETSKCLCTVLIGGKFSSSHNSRNRATISSIISVGTRVITIAINGMMAISMGQKRMDVLCYIISGGVFLTIVRKAIIDSKSSIEAQE